MAVLAENEWPMVKIMVCLFVWPGWRQIGIDSNLRVPAPNFTASADDLTVLLF